MDFGNKIAGGRTRSRFLRRRLVEELSNELIYQERQNICLHIHVDPFEEIEAGTVWFVVFPSDLMIVSMACRGFHARKSIGDIFG